MDVFKMHEASNPSTSSPSNHVNGFHANGSELKADTHGLNGNSAGVPGGSGGGSARAMYMDPNVIDPFKLMEPQLRSLSESIKLLVQSDNPVLDK
jgi:hypothetical protein